MTDEARQLHGQTSPQPDLFAARQRGRTGMQRAADAAERRARDWGGAALAGLRAFATAHDEPFTIEAARAGITIAAPPDGRAWGAVTQTAIRTGIIAKVVGKFAPASSSNGAPKQLYVRGRAA